MSNAARQLARAREKNGHSPANGHAPQSDLPDIVDGADFWRLQAQGSALEQRRQELRAVQAEIREIERDYNAAAAAFRSKYAITDTDQIHPETLKIIREKVLPVQALTPPELDEVEAVEEAPPAPALLPKP